MDPRPETPASLRDPPPRRACRNDHPHRRRLPDPTGYGRVPRVAPHSPEVTAIVEQKSLTPDQLNAPEINSGIYCFETEALFAKLDLLSTNNAHAEFYLTDVAAMLVGDGLRVVALQASSVNEVLGANTIAEMMHLDQAIRHDAVPSA